MSKKRGNRMSSSNKPVVKIARTTANAVQINATTVHAPVKVAGAKRVAAVAEAPNAKRQMVKSPVASSTQVKIASQKPAAAAVKRPASTSGASVAEAAPKKVKVAKEEEEELHSEERSVETDDGEDLEGFIVNSDEEEDIEEGDAAEVEDEDEFTLETYKKEMEDIKKMFGSRLKK